MYVLIGSVTPEVDICKMTPRSKTSKIISIDNVTQGCYYCCSETQGATNCVIHEPHLFAVVNDVLQPSRLASNLGSGDLATLVST